MANPEHFKILKQGVKVWNKWRKDNPDVKPDLSEAYLKKAHLEGADLNGANLREADLSRANLISSNLRGADLSGAELSSANLCRAYLSGANLRGTDLSGADLSKANFRRAYLRGANLRRADLSGASLSQANLRGADLSGADFHEAYIGGANLSGADLSETNLSGADLHSADIISANLTNANITGVCLYGTARDNWKIDGIKCDYVYFDAEREERIPKDRDFEPGEFEELYRYLPTIDYYFENGFTPLDAVIMDKVVQAINEQHPEFELKLDSFHSRGQPHATFTVLHKEVADEALQQIASEYDTKIKVLEGQKEQLMEVISNLSNRPQVIKVANQFIGQYINGDKTDIHAVGDVSYAKDRGEASIVKGKTGLVSDDDTGLKE